MNGSQLSPRQPYVSSIYHLLDGIAEPKFRRVFKDTMRWTLSRSADALERLLKMISFALLIIFWGCWRGEPHNPATASIDSTKSATQSHFKTTGSMTLARRYHHAVLLTDGTVLIIGGLDDSIGIDPKIAEIYDASTGVFHRTGSMQSIVRPLLAIQLDDGTALVYGQREEWLGGPDPRPMSLNLPVEFAAELYDPKSQSFVPVPSMEQVLPGGKATLMADGRILFSGGSSPDGVHTPGLYGSSSAELYDAKSRTWLATGSMHDPRVGHSATCLNNGTVLIAGGRNESEPLSTAEIYDPGTGKFRQRGLMIHRRAGHTALRLPDGDVVIIGGSDAVGGSWLSAELYQAQKERFVSAGQLYDPGLGSYGRHEIVSQSAILLLNGSILIMEIANVRGPLMAKRRAYTEIYDPARETSKLLDDQTTAREGSSATLLGNGNVLIGGGQNSADTKSLSSAELYVP